MAVFRCRCGVWSDYGMTCVSCRQETYRNMRPSTTTEKGEPEEVVDVVDEDAEEEEDE